MKTRTKTSILLLFTAILFTAGMLLFSADIAHAKKIKISQTSAFMAKGEKLTLKVTGTTRTPKWSSGNKKVAVVSAKGKVTAKKTGQTVITAKVGSKKLKCKITVEKTTVHKARILRDYILEKGKYSSESDNYVLSYYTQDPDTGDTTTVQIAASEQDQKLYFYYCYRPDAPSSSKTVTLDIDLISGKSGTKKGRAEYTYSEPDVYRYDAYTAKITTKYNCTNKGLTLTEYRYMDYSYDEDTGEELENFITVKDKAKLAEESHTVFLALNEAFDVWNDTFKSVKKMKKAGISMKSIGFTKWTSDVRF